MITAPDIFHAGVAENISVAIFEQNEPIQISITLEIRGNLIATASKTVKKRGIISVTAPAGFEGKALLTVCGNCHLQNGYIFSNRTSVTISPRGTVALIKERIIISKKNFY